MGDKMLSSSSAFEALWRIFVNMIQDPLLKSVHILLDGLDECDEPLLPTFLEKLRLLMVQDQWSSENVIKLVVISRSTPNCILTSLSKFPRLCLDTDFKKEIGGGIRKFITAKVFDTRKIGPDSSQSKRKLENVMLKGSQGTFLWVGFVAKELKSKTLEEVLEKLEDIPAGLDGIYNRMLGLINRHRRKTAIQIFRWVLVAVRRLSLLELGAAIGIQYPPDVAAEDFVRERVRYCGDFLNLTGGDQVGFVHQSARDYFFRSELAESEELGEFYVEKDDAHFEIANTCLTYIQGEAFLEGPINMYLNDEVTELIGGSVRIKSCRGPVSGRGATSAGHLDRDSRARLERFPLVAYATLHWPEHVRNSSSTVETIFDLTKPFFMENSSLRDSWFQSYLSTTRLGTGIFREPTPSMFALIHIASYLGLDPLLQKLLPPEKWSWNPKPTKIEQPDSVGRTPLFLASLGGHPSTVRLLIKKGANVNFRDNNGRTGLMEAAVRGYVSVVDELTKSGTKLNTTDRDNVSSLMHAAQYGHTTSVRLLIERGADPEIKDKDFERTALLWAVANRHDAVVETLIQSKANLEAKDGDYGRTALIFAAWKRQSEMVAIILRSKVNIHAKDDFNRSALDRAVLNGDYRTLDVIINHMAANRMSIDGGPIAMPYRDLPPERSPMARRQLANSFMLLKKKYEQEDKASPLALVRAMPQAFQVLRTEFNVLLLGDTGVGKTNLLNRLVSILLPYPRISGSGQ
jgi:ankyrin repeat domain-containing protein 50